jgi:methylase of polypeptide subunit release factors
MIKITELAHRIIEEKSHINIAIDMTCGRGYDTLYLAKKSSKVYAFDIQEEALNSTSALLKENKIDNVKLILSNHDKVSEYVKENFDVAIYNLGYLPQGNKDIKTTTSSTIDSLKQLLDLMNPEGIIIIVIYPHNPEEGAAIEELVLSLDSDYDCVSYKVLNKKECPYIITIKKG